MAKPLLDDNLWALIEPLRPPVKPRRLRYPGRIPISHRQALTGILFVPITGIPWAMLPREMGCGSGVSCRRRLRDRQALGVWDELSARVRWMNGDDAIGLICRWWPSIPAASAPGRTPRTNRPQSHRSRPAPAGDEASPDHRPRGHCASVGDLRRE